MMVNSTEMKSVEKNAILAFDCEVLRLCRTYFPHVLLKKGVDGLTICLGDQIRVGNFIYFCVVS